MNREIRGKLNQLAESDQWSPYCRDIEDTMLRLMTASVLENSKKLRGEQAAITPPGVPESAFYSFVTAVMRGIRTHALVSVQPAITEVSPIFFIQRVGGASGEGNIPEVNMQITSQPVAANRSVSAGAEWTMNAEMARRSMERDPGMAVRLLSGLAHELAASIDNMIMRELWEGTKTEIEHKTATGVRGLVDATLQGAGTILANTGRGTANSIIVSQCIHRNMLRRDREIFQPDTGNYDGEGLRKVGRLLDRWDVFEYPYFTDENVLFCANGSSWLDSGYVFAPHAVILRAVTDTSSYSQRLAFSLLYGSAMVNPLHFCKCRFIFNEPEVTIKEVERPKLYRKLTINYG